MASEVPPPTDIRVSLDLLDAAAAAVETADHELQAAQKRLTETIDSLGESVRALATVVASAPDRRDALARRVYWRHLRVPVRDIVVAFGYARQHDLLLIVGTTSAGIPCERCGEVLRATSRSRLKEIQEAEAGRPKRHGKNLLCDACDADERAARDAEYEAEQVQYLALRNAWVPAQTAEWAAAAELVLSCPPEASHDRLGSFYAQKLAKEILAPGKQAQAVLEVQFEAAEEIAQTAAEIAIWDEITATRTIHAAGVSGTASALAKRLAAAVAATRAAVLDTN